MDESQQTATTPEQQKGTSPMLVIGIIVVIIVIIGAFWMTNNQSKTVQEAVVPTLVPTEATMEDSSNDSMMEKAIEVEGGNFYFNPNEIRVKKGEKVTINLANKGGIHNFIIDEFSVKSETIQGDASTIIEFTPDKTGTFEFYCSIGNHRQMGMKGKLIVE